tara:strand:- start:1923 stop:2222 length:300 start_codon:yes stop_codon:yes gene_type:complete
MTKTIQTKFGVIRENLKGELKGYVNLGKRYFGKSEQEIIMDYVDMGYIIDDNKYIMQGGKSIIYLYKYMDHHGDIHEEELPQVEHPTMMMVTKLKNLCT